MNVPIGLVMIYLARTTLTETSRERMKLDAAGAILATLACTAAVFGFSMGPEKGWMSADAGPARGRPLFLAFVGCSAEHRPVQPVPGPQPGGHLRGGLPGRGVMFTLRPS